MTLKYCEFFMREKRSCIQAGGDPDYCWCYREWMIVNKHLVNYGYVRE